MARNKGTFNFSANLEPKVQAPLDARTVVDTVAELTQAATWQDTNNDVWLYDGLVVSVAQTGELYMLTNKAAYTSAESWKRIDAGEAEGKGVITLGNISKYLDSPVGTDVSEVFDDYTLAELFGREAAGKIVRFAVYDEMEEFTTGYQPILFAEAYDTMGLGYRVLIKSKSNNTPDVYFHELFFSEEDGVKKLTKNTKLWLLTDEQWTEVSDKVLLEDFSAVWELTTESTPVQIKEAIPSSLWEELFAEGFPIKVSPTVWLDTAPSENTGGACPVSVVCTNGWGENWPVTISELMGDKLYVLKLDSEDGIDYKVISNSVITVGEAVESVTSGSGAIEIGGTMAKPTVGLKLDGTGNVKLTQAASGLKAEYKPIATQLAELVKDGDQVLHVETTGQQDPAKLAVTIGLDYDSGTKKIKLTGINSAVIAEIDAADFIKDGMVQSVELEGNNLVITFNTDAGTEEITVDLSKFIDVYEAGGGITISGKTISVNIKPEEKYLTSQSGYILTQGIDEAIEAAITEAFSWHEVGE